MEANMLRINKDVLNKVLKNINYSTDIRLDYLNDDYIIEYGEYTRLKNEFDLLVRFKEKDINYNLSYIDFSKYKSLKKKYEDLFYGKVRNKFELLKDKDYSEEEIIKAQLDMLDEINNILKIKSTIRSIKNKIEEIKKNNLSYSITSIEYSLDEYLKNGATYEKYNVLDSELSEMIRRTYKNNIAYIMPIDYVNSNVLINEKNNNYIMNKKNIYNFSYGYIIHPKYITFASNDGSNRFVSYNDLDKENYKITTKNNKPLGIYAVTLGEKSLNDNYKEALKLQQKYKDIPLMEIDLTKVLLSDDIKEYLNKLIDNLLVDKGIEIENKDSKFYEHFNYFHEEFNKLKLTEYNEGNIINLFEFCFDLIFSQKYITLDKLLNSNLSVESIKEVLENNIYYDFNIFKSSNITKEDVLKFKDAFISYKNNRELNIIYPGINIILDYLENINGKKIEDLLSVINGSFRKDSWLIAQTINPTHKKINIDDNKKDRLNVVQSEKEKLNGLLNTLKSMDNDNGNIRK